MNSPVRKLFGEANDLWFRQGRTAEAIRKYQAASSADPENPIILFQLARALWATSRADEARRTFSQAQQHQQKLSSFGLKVFSREVKKFGNSPEFCFPVPSFVPALDLDVLQKQDLSPAQWSDIAYAAREREMFGLAAHAFGQSSGPVRILEVDQDEREMYRAADDALNALVAMDAGIEPNLIVDSAYLNPVAGSFTGGAGQLSSSHSDVSPTQIIKTETALQPPGQSRLELAPVRVTIVIEPRVSLIKERLNLTVTLTNGVDKPVAVNARLLLNHPNSPPDYGELYLAVEGPANYENSVAFHVRTGRPKPGHFVLLSPGEGVSKSYDLFRYESLDLPGQYQVWVTYRNLVRDSVRGFPLFVGAVSSPAVAVERLTNTSNLQPRLAT